MAGNFQPLDARLGLVGNAAGHSFRLKVLPSSSPAPAGSAAPPLATAQTPLPDSHEPTITLQREGERITAIQIKCSCGKLIELGCVY